ncbi:hypothetical protein STEG23_032653, partial [Scotinomys teguina]
MPVDAHLLPEFLLPGPAKAAEVTVQCAKAVVEKSILPSGQLVSLIAQALLAELKMRRSLVAGEHHGPLPAVSAPKKEQGAKLKRHLDPELIRNMSVAPTFYKNGKQLFISQPRSRRVLTVHKSEARPCKTPQEEPRCPHARPKRFSSVILQSRATPRPLLLQPKAPNATKQDSVADALEWQRKMEAAEALLALKNSSQVPPDSASLEQCASMP